MNPRAVGPTQCPNPKGLGYSNKENALNTKQANDFFALFERSSIKWVIYAAGIAAVLDILHTLFLAARFLFRFDHF